jgi:hypothetical protein
MTLGRAFRLPPSLFELRRTGRATRWLHPGYAACVTTSARETCRSPRRSSAVPWCSAAGGRSPVGQPCRLADIRKRLLEKWKSSRLPTMEVSPSLIIIQQRACEGSASNKWGAAVLTMLARSILMSALLFSAARAQPAASPPEVDQQPPLYAPAPVPVPANGCAWAGRSFSDGAGFCITDRFMQICAAGKWVREPATEGCHGALADTK